VHRDPSPARHLVRRRALAAGFVVLALAGEWVGHAATWYLTGGATPGQALAGTAHRYLGPVGVVIALVAMAASWLVWRGLRRLAALARSFDLAGRRAWREGAHPVAPVVSPREAAHAAAELGFSRLWIALAAVQIVVYLVQENLEVRLAGHGWLGLQAVTAHHGSAIAIHAAIALLGAALAVEVSDRWRFRTQVATVAIAAYRALTWRRASRVGPLPRPRPSTPPLLLVGRSILSRPPPSLQST